MQTCDLSRPGSKVKKDVITGFFEEFIYLYERLLLLGDRYCRSGSPLISPWFFHDFVVCFLVIYYVHLQFLLLSESGIFLLFYYVVVRCYYLLIPEENCIWCWFIDTDHFFRKNIKPKTGKKLWYLAHNRRYLLSSRLSFSIEEVKVTSTDHVTPWWWVVMVGKEST